MTKVNVVILGDGGWGTTLAVHLHKQGHHVTLWGAFPEYCAHVAKTRENEKFLRGVKIPRGIAISSNLSEAVFCKDLIVLAVPSVYLRGVLEKLKEVSLPHRSAFLSVVKGIEISSLKRMSEVIHEELGSVKLAVLSGPTIAQELAHGLVTTAVIASNDIVLRKRLQSVFMSDNFRVYTNDDVIGVELGGSLKNIIAIACGIADGLGFGSNAKAALLTRGLAEISRLGRTMGARVSTFSGLSGLGDLVTTCVSQQSRNRSVGEQIGRGKTLKQITAGMQMVAEGVPTAKSAYLLGKKFDVELPIINEIYAVLYKNKSAKRAVVDLMTRERKEE